jgi:mono/diheme cytochrome c family protein
MNFLPFHYQGIIMKRLIGLCVALLAIGSSSAATLDGKALFEQNCAACHGVDGKGGNQDVKGPKLVGDSTTWSLKLFRRAVLEGKDDKGQALEAPMPHWKDTSFQADHGKPPTASEISAIYGYLRTLK